MSLLNLEVGTKKYGGSGSMLTVLPLCRIIELITQKRFKPESLIFRPSK